MDFDDILKEVAQALYKDSDVDVLGKALGFGPAEIGRKIEENTTHGENYMGTLDLLITWRKRQTPSMEKAVLRSTLLKVGFKNLADKHLTTSVTVKTTSFPSSPKTITSTYTATTTPTTATATTSTPTATQKAILVITYLAWAAVSVSGTTPELSTTTGDTVNIPCLFGEGMLHYIRWYYNNSSGRQNILISSEGDFTIETKYADRAILHDDKSTLILKEITVADEGTYHCVVDTLKQPAVSNIKTKLNVFSLRPNTLPVISPCTGADESSSCSIHANQPFTITCTLPSVYPVEDTKLIWYQDGKHFSSIHDVTQNDDGTTDFSRQIKIYETGNFTCNATYISVNGRENTAISVEARIILPTDVPNTPVKNMTSGKIAGIIIGIVLLVAISLAINNLFLYLWKARGRRLLTISERPLSQLSSTNDERSHAELAELTERPTAYFCVNQCGFVATSTEETKRPGTSAVNGSTDRNASAQSSEPTGRPKANYYRSKEEEPTLLWTSEENESQDDNDDSSVPLPSSTVRRRNVMRSDLNSDEIFDMLAKHMPSDIYATLCTHLGIEYNESKNILVQVSNDSQKATRSCLAQWKTRTGGDMAVLKTILQEIEVGDLAKYIK